MSNKINPKKSTIRYITIKLMKTKNKEKHLKTIREKLYFTYKEEGIRRQQFSHQKQWKSGKQGSIFQELKENNHQPRTL